MEYTHAHTRIPYRFSFSRPRRWRLAARYILSFLSGRLRIPRQSCIGPSDANVNGALVIQFFFLPPVHRLCFRSRKRPVLVNGTYLLKRREKHAIEK